MTVSTELRKKRLLYDRILNKRLFKSRVMKLKIEKKRFRPFIYFSSIGHSEWVKKQIVI